jgi:hypothetical protein
MHPNCRRIAAAALALGASGLLSGCGGVEDPFERSPVKGTVELDGEPVPYGQLLMVGEKDADTQQAAQLIMMVRDGAFDSGPNTGTTPGPNEVTVTLYDSDPTGEDSEANPTGRWTSQVTVEADKPVSIVIPAGEVTKPQ